MRVLPITLIWVSSLEKERTVLSIKDSRGSLVEMLRSRFLILLDDSNLQEIKLDREGDASEVDKIKQEISIQRDLKFKYIVPIFSLFHNETVFYMTMPCLSGGSLYDMINEGTSVIVLGVTLRLQSKVIDDANAI